MTIRKMLTLAGLCLGAVSCDAAAPPGPPPPDTPGAAVVSLETADQDVGALIVTVHGPAVSADESALQPAVGAYELFSRRVSTEAVRVVVIGDVSAGPLFSLHVGAAGRPQAYSVTVDQVATRGNALRDDLTGYRAALSAGGP